MAFGGFMRSEGRRRSAQLIIIFTVGLLLIPLTINPALVFPAWAAVSYWALSVFSPPGKKVLAAPIGIQIGQAAYFVCLIALGLTIGAGRTPIANLYVEAAWVVILIGGSLFLFLFQNRWVAVALILYQAFQIIQFAVGVPNMLRMSDAAENPIVLVTVTTIARGISCVLAIILLIRALRSFRKPMLTPVEVFD